MIGGIGDIAPYIILLICDGILVIANFIINHDEDVGRIQDEQDSRILSDRYPLLDWVKEESSYFSSDSEGENPPPP